ELPDRAPAELEQRLGDLAVELGRDRGCDLLLRTTLELVDLRLRVDIDAPAGELRREPHVLALLADRERELVVGDDQLHAVALGVDDHALHLGGCDRVAHEASRVVIVRDDVDLLAAQLLHDGLHAAALHADARADRVDVAVARRHGDLRARTGLASARLDANDLLVDLRDLLLEQLLEQALVRARQDDLRATRVAVDVEAIRLDRITDAVALAGHLLAHRQHGFRLADVDDQRAALEAPHDARDDLALAVLELV